MADGSFTVDLELYQSEVQTALIPLFKAYEWYSASLRLAQN